MRRLTTLISYSFTRRPIPPPDHPPPMSAVVRQRINRVLRRRLSDRVNDVFQEACMAGDLDTATELLAVMEAMQERRQVAMGDRRISNEELLRATEDLASRLAERAALADRATEEA
jgi:hypothetical protein